MLSCPPTPACHLWVHVQLGRTSQGTGRPWLSDCFLCSTLTTLEELVSAAVWIIFAFCFCAESLIQQTFTARLPHVSDSLGEGQVHTNEHKPEHAAEDRPGCCAGWGDTYGGGSGKHS